MKEKKGVLRWTTDFIWGWVMIALIVAIGLSLVIPHPKLEYNPVELFSAILTPAAVYAGFRLNYRAIREQVKANENQDKLLKLQMDAIEKQAKSLEEQVKSNSIQYKMLMNQKKNEEMLTVIKLAELLNEKISNGIHKVYFYAIGIDSIYSYKTYEFNIEKLSRSIEAMNELSVLLQKENQNPLSRIFSYDNENLYRLIKSEVRIGDISFIDLYANIKQIDSIENIMNRFIIDLNLDDVVFLVMDKKRTEEVFHQENLYIFDKISSDFDFYDQESAYDLFAYLINKGIDENVSRFVHSYEGDSGTSFINYSISRAKIYLSNMRKNKV